MEVAAYMAENGVRDPDFGAISQWFMNVCQAYDQRVAVGISVHMPLSPQRSTDFKHYALGPR
jgi:hypothetical protein